MVKDLVIVDLDGTLSDPEHRRHLVNGPKGGRDWKQFLELAIEDPVKPFTVSVVQNLHKSGFEVQILSGRNRKYLQDSAAWLDQYEIPYDSIDFPRHGENSYTEDCKLKGDWLDSKGKVFEDRIACCIDDRDQVVNMWRKRGLVCWQVAEGNF